VVARFHGDEAAAAAEQHFDRLFVTHEAPEDVPEFVVVEGPEDAVFLPALIAEVFGRSGSEARRLLAQGGVKLDGEAIPAGTLELPREKLAGRVLQVGKRHFARLVTA
jgi:tyrosyl-tRNA synthetase